MNKLNKSEDVKKGKEKTGVIEAGKSSFPSFRQNTLFTEEAQVYKGSLVGMCTSF